MARIAVILSGAGVFDGSEIYETVLTLIALDKTGVHVTCLAPNKPFTPVDHLTQKLTSEERNVLNESARIVRARSAIWPRLIPTSLTRLFCLVALVRQRT